MSGGAEAVISICVPLIYVAILVGTVLILCRSKFRTPLTDILCLFGALSSLTLPLAIASISKPTTLQFMRGYENSAFIFGLFGAPLIYLVGAITRSFVGPNERLVKLTWAVFLLMVLAPALTWAILVAVRFGDGA